METLNFVGTELHKSSGGLFAKRMPEDGWKLIVGRITKRRGWLDAQLAKKAYLLGDDYSVADAYAFTVLNWGQWVGIAMKDWPNVSAYMDRVAARPAVQAAMKSEGMA